MATKAEATPKGADVEATESEAKPTVLVVTAPLIAATIGKQVLHFRQGDILPAGTDPANLENLKSLGFVAESE